MLSSVIRQKTLSSVFQKFSKFLYILLFTSFIFWFNSNSINCNSFSKKKFPKFLIIQSINFSKNFPNFFIFFYLHLFFSNSIQIQLIAIFFQKKFPKFLIIQSINVIFHTTLFPKILQIFLYSSIYIFYLLIQFKFN